MRAELFVRAMQRAFVEQVQVIFSEHALVLHFHSAFSDEDRRAADTHPRDSAPVRVDRDMYPTRPAKLDTLQIQNRASLLGRHERVTNQIRAKRTACAACCR